MQKRASEAQLKNLHSEGRLYRYQSEQELKSQQDMKRFHDSQQKLHHRLRDYYQGAEKLWEDHKKRQKDKFDRHQVSVPA